MKKKKPYSETRKKSIKLNCLVSGVIFIAIGIFFGVIITLQNDSYEYKFAVYMISALAVGFGIFQLFSPKIIEKAQAEERNPETFAYRQLMKRRERAQKKILKKDSRAHKSLKQELFGQQLVYAGIMAAIFPLLGYYLYTSLYGIFSAVLIIIMCAFLLMLIYYVCGFGYSSLKKIARKNGLNFAAVEDDFLGSAAYGTFNSFISIGFKYTIIIGEGLRQILENKSILSVMPFYQKTDTYNNGIYSGTVTTCFIIIATENGSSYKVRCAEFVEELIIGDFLKNQSFMNENFVVEYPENVPAYIQK